MKLVKDDGEILYHLGKANMVTDALSRRLITDIKQVTKKPILQKELMYA